MERKFIRDFLENETISSFFVVFSKDLRKTKADKEYLDLTLMDKSGSINAKIWDNVDNFAPKFEKGDAVAVKASVTSFNNELQLKIDSIRRAILEQDQAYGFDFNDLIPSTDKDIQQMWTEVMEGIETLENPYLKQLTKNIYLENEEALRVHPASMILHHAFRGGLLEHTHSMLKMAEGICRNYSDLDRDLIISGVLLHDIGKLQELEPNLVTNYTDSGNFIGHVVLGRDMLREAIARIEQFPEILKLKMEHIILAHQGKLEWQSPREPLFPEALLVYYIDEIDTRINQMRREIESDSTEGNWTNKNNYFHRALYKGSLSEYPGDSNDPGK
ncbi:MAG TPA: HD domain-containing protein [Candidatus Marinimicrobia bacterium]|nr:HD domain-containing protein [Candidatus Neomarinimicrobiota bacterium]